MLKSIEPVVLAELLSTQADIQLIDVREVFEREICHFGGLHIPLAALDGQVLESLDPKKQTVVYCRSGARSATACHKLNHLGFEHVYNLSGGILRWIETVDGCLTRY